MEVEEEVCGRTLWPAPEGPKMPRNSPGRTWPEMLCRIFLAGGFVANGFLDLSGTSNDTSLKVSDNGVGVMSEFVKSMFCRTIFRFQESTVLPK